MNMSTRFSPGGTKPRGALLRQGWGHESDTGLHLSDGLLAASRQSGLVLRVLLAADTVSELSAGMFLRIQSNDITFFISLSQSTLSNPGKIANHE